MIIQNNVIDQIRNTIGRCRNESGGLVGSIDGRSITHFAFDHESTENEYIPDVKKLNKLLSEWKEEKIRFFGIIHSHHERKNLSAADVQYARQILDLNRFGEVSMLLYILQTREMILYHVNGNNVYPEELHVQVNE